MLMGNVTNLHLEVVQDKGIKGNFPIFKKLSDEGYVTLLNDTIEVGRPTSIDTVEVGSGRIQINYNVPVQVFDSGVYRLPEIEFASGKDTARSKSLLLTVDPVKGLTANDSIAPLTDIADPEGSTVLDSVPDWLYYYWWIILLGVVLIIAAFYLYKKYKKEGTLLPVKTQRRSPYEQAIHDLKALNARKLWESGREKEYYTVLTDILRRYLDERFGIQAMEMTSKEIMSHLADLRSSDVPRDKMRDILDMADFVKFAKVRPLPDDNIALYKNALDFVESTKPDPMMEESLKNESSASDKVSSSKENKSDSSESDKAKEHFDDSGIGLIRRGRKARRDDSSSKISGQRLKVGRKEGKK